MHYSPLVLQPGVCALIVGWLAVLSMGPFAPRHTCAHLAPCLVAWLLQFSTAAFAATRPGGRPGRGRGAGGASTGVARPRRQGGAASGSADAAFNGVLQLGQPLPDRGTCRHYR